MVEQAPVLSPAHQHAFQAVCTLLHHGITDIVYCPGSRNAPLAAILAQAATAGRLRIHTRIDERAASFFALGLARVTGRPAAVITTSGTAATNCLPAMTEAFHAGVPLLVITADRPPRLVGTGASQTITQPGIFTQVATTVAAQPEWSAAQLEQEFSTALSAQLTVHLNLPFDEPLYTDDLPELHFPTPGRYRRPTVDAGEITLDLSRPTLVIAGDGAWDIPELADVPTIAEPTAPAPYVPVHPLAAGVFAKGQLLRAADEVTTVIDTAPAQIVVVGHPTLHREVLGLISNPDIELYCLSQTGRFTTLGRAAHSTGSRVKTSGEPSKQWLQICTAASEMAIAAVKTTIADQPERFTGFDAAAVIADSIAHGDTVFLAASNPVRDMALMGMPFDGISCVSPRGAAGIDGSFSQAVGVAVAAQSLDPTAIPAPRTVAVIGDVAALHDAGGLLIPTGSYPENLTLLVLNDQGGSIFETVAHKDALGEAVFEQFFAVPHAVDFEQLAAAYGVNFRQADSRAQLQEVLDDLEAQPHGITLVEVVVSRAERREIAQALASKVVG